jgi:hypothetical protein
MSDVQFDSLTPLDFFTMTHRITGQVQTGKKPLCDLLNDRSQSYLLVHNVYVSRLNAPGEIGAHASVAYLSKENLGFVIVPSREVRLPEQSRFTSQEYRTLATLPGFEVRGTFPGPPRFDLRTFSPANLDAFITLTDVSVQITDLPEVIFSGEAVLINRARLESLCLSD